jgi:hypothetical protein
MVNDQLMSIHTFNGCKHGLSKYSKLGYTALFDLTNASWINLKSMMWLYIFVQLW